MRFAAAVLCGGSGTRFGADKLSIELGNKPVWRHSFDTLSSICEEVFVVGPGELRGSAPGCEGGSSRTESVRNAVEYSRDRCDALIVHDGARPVLHIEDARSVLAAIERSGAAALCASVTDTIRNRRTGEVVDRDQLVAMQTPQGATIARWLEAYSNLAVSTTDDYALLAANGQSVEFVPAGHPNPKLTHPGDLSLIRAILGKVDSRTGFGYDVHRFASDDRPLYLGGIEFSGERGLDGHSDADVLLHAITDAVLGAAALGDIGQHFPPSDPQWKGRRSTHFLAEAVRMARLAGWELVHLDATLVAEQPKIGPKSKAMLAAIAEAAGIEVSRVSVKATTNEGMGALGRSEGIAAFATATLSR